MISPHCSARDPNNVTHDMQLWYASLLVMNSPRLRYRYHSPRRRRAILDDRDVQDPLRDLRDPRERQRKGKTVARFYDCSAHDEVCMRVLTAFSRVSLSLSRRNFTSGFYDCGLFITRMIKVDRWLRVGCNLNERDCRDRVTSIPRQPGRRTAPRRIAFAEGFVLLRERLYRNIVTRIYVILLMENVERVVRIYKTLCDVFRIIIISLPSFSRYDTTTHRILPI